MWTRRATQAALLPASAQGFYSFYYYGHNYYGHNLHFLWAAAELERVLPLEKVRQKRFLEFVVPTKFFGMVRFGRWEDVLREPLQASRF